MKDDFQIELLGTYPLEECLEREKELAKTSIFPKGLNGNAGRYIIRTKTGDEKVKYSVRQRVKNGTHNFLGPESNKKRVDAGTHNFQETGEKRSERASEYIQIRLSRGDHPWQGDRGRDLQKRRIENGTHNFSGNGLIVAFDIENGTISKIPKELYSSRKDKYFTLRSLVYRNWKEKDNGRESTRLP